REQAEQRRDAAVAQQRSAEAQAAQSAAVARARELVSVAASSENTNPELAVLIATQAVAATWPWGHAVLPEAQQQLDNSILASHLGGKIGESELVASIAWSPDSKRLVTGNLDKTAKAWDTETGEALFTLSGHNDSVNSVAWSEDNSWLATGSLDHAVKIW